MTDSIVDPRMLQELRQFYPAACTIEENTDATYTDSGQPRESWQPLDEDHTDIPCSVGPPDGKSSGGGREIRRPDSTVARSTHRIGLRGYFPAITTKMRALAGGRTYNILAVLHDSHGKSSYLDTEIIQ